MKKKRLGSAESDWWSGVAWADPPKQAVDRLLARYGVGARFVPAAVPEPEPEPVSDAEYAKWS